MTERVITSAKPGTRGGSGVISDSIPVISESALEDSDADIFYPEGAYVLFGQKVSPTGVGFLVETGGAVVFQSGAGFVRRINLPDNGLYVGQVQRVYGAADGTTASGIHIAIEA